MQVNKIEGSFGSIRRMRLLTEKTLDILDDAFHKLECQVPAPQWVQRNNGGTFRYSEKTVQQAIILKLARMVSGLRTARLLLENGFIQEQAAIQRILGEIAEDILFLVCALTIDELTTLHQRYLDAFYKEEFDDEDDPVTSEQKRAMVPRSKIQAYCPSSNKWDRCLVLLRECFAHHFHVTRRVVDSANDVSR